MKQVPKTWLEKRQARQKELIAKEKKRKKAVAKKKKAIRRAAPMTTGAKAITQKTPKKK